ncbi:hypothetical protein [Catellatospora citrea]|uniref:Uncharacterized protein n=1 Tax=Catellatospora citrea TaxID=53366 RepID=A0A8J3NZN1_9ACTN|nr:hypothetical protein [Catellatospora citrea]RKE08106.1 hypothetical protein C8E86_2949 [Catellatospora citrea]GIF98487.1 hypothetical protein Cci01nite_35810 [Catellatospora citrea]
MAATPARARGRYAKPVVLPDGLDSLTGPTSGIVSLPRHLKWSGTVHYDLEEPGRIMDLYRTVINEAAAPDDLHRYLDEAVLRSLWETIFLSAPVRSAWERRFPDLATTRTSVDVA